MINRLLAKEVELIPDGNIINLKSPMKLEYYLIESDLVDMDELSGKIVYGIEIIKRTDGINDEMSVVRNLSCCKESTENLIGTLAANTVTPVTLPYILDDMLGL